MYSQTVLRRKEIVDDGVHFWQFSDNYLVGGPTVAEGNIIAYNDVGIFVRYGEFNKLTHNSIFCNTNEGIKLDASNGNGNYASPTISSATGGGASGTAAANDIIEIYGNHACGPDCEGKTFMGETTADGSGNWTYTGALTGEITAIAISSTNDNTSAFATCVTVVGGPPPVANFSSNVTDGCPTLCVDFQDLSANNPTSWSWTFTGATPASSTDQNPMNICYDTPGSYDVSLTVTNNDGSDNVTFTSHITVHTPPTVDLGNDTLICVSCTLTLDADNAGSTYLWSTGATTQTIDVTTPGTYWVEVTDGNGCMAVDSIVVTNDASIGSGNEITFSLYPNPANDQVIIQTTETNLLFELYDLSGKVILRQQLGSSENLIDLSKISNGVYTYRVVSSKSTTPETGKLVISK